MELQPNEPDKGTTVDLPNPDVPTAGPAGGTPITQPAPDFLDTVEAEVRHGISAVKSVFQTVETDALAVIGNLGHVRKALDSFSFSPELGAAKDYVNQAIIAIAQHVGG